MIRAQTTCHWSAFVITREIQRFLRIAQNFFVNDAKIFRKRFSSSVHLKGAIRA
jgi:hypothetical protein